MPFARHDRSAHNDHAHNDHARDHSAGDQGALVAAVGLLAIGFGAMVILDGRNGTLRDGFVGQTIVWWFVAFAGFGLAAWCNERRSIDLRVIWAVAVAARLVLLLTEPTLSDDVYRYLWEGHLVTEGVSPYAFAIADPAGDAFDIAARGLANNQALASPYLPFAHGVFGAAALVLPSEPWTMQLLMIGCDLGAIAVLIAVLSKVGLPKRRALLYAWNPLVIVEVAHGAHIDALIGVLVLSSVLFVLGPRRSDLSSLRGVLATAASPTLFAAAILTRPIAAVLVVVLFWRWTWVQRGIAFVSTVLPVLVVGSISGFGLGASTAAGVFGSAREYAQTFRFNSAIYQRFESLGLSGDPAQLTRIFIYALVSLAMLVIFVRARRVHDDLGLVRSLVAPLAVYVIATPVLHPWYLLLGLMLAVAMTPTAAESARRWLVIAPWIVLSALVTLTYLTYRDPTAFGELRWVSRVVWYPVTVLCVLAVAALATLPRLARPTPASDSPENLR